MVWNSIPTQLSRENKKFVYGLVREGAMSRLNKRILLEGDRLFEEFKGALTEQYVLQQLIVHEEMIFFTGQQNEALGKLTS